MNIGDIPVRFRDIHNTIIPLNRVIGFQTGCIHKPGSLGVLNGFPNNLVNIFIDNLGGGITIMELTYATLSAAVYTDDSDTRAEDVARLEMVCQPIDIGSAEFMKKFRDDTWIKAHEKVTNGEATIRSKRRTIAKPTVEEAKSETTESTMSSDSSSE